MKSSNSENSPASTHYPPLTTSQRLALAIGSSIVAEVTTYPLDYIKTKLQIQGECSRDSQKQ